MVLCVCMCVCVCALAQGINITQSLGGLHLRRGQGPTLQECVNLEGLQSLNVYATLAHR